MNTEPTQNTDPTVCTQPTCRILEEPNVTEDMNRLTEAKAEV